MTVGDKYVNLKIFLNKQKKSMIRLSYKDIENIIGDTLPKSAYNYSEAWWSNCYDLPQAKAWMEAGFLTDFVTETYKNKEIVFVKNDTVFENNN